MPHVTFIYPCIGRFEDTKYVRSWQMQPLNIAVLSGLTPPSWDRTFFDDRLEDIDYEINTDMVAISVETYTARRAYQIAKRFQQRAIPVVMGGYHATLCSQEVQDHADAVCIGEAEPVWHDILDDAENGRLQEIYKSSGDTSINFAMDRDVFKGKNYLDIGLIETGRGCPFQCNFCSVTAFHKASYRRRPIDPIIQEIQELPQKHIFFVDDNLIADFKSAKELFRAIIPYKIKWVSQASINLASDNELMKLMVESGCMGVLIGFESLCSETIKDMNKGVNAVSNYSDALAKIRESGIPIYGTFMFGNGKDTHELMDETFQFTINQKMFLAAFNHIVPFPGTPLYQSLEDSGLLKYEKWWMSDEYRFGQMPYKPEKGLSDAEVETGCMELRRRFYSLGSIVSRSLDLKSNCKTLKKGLSFWGLNLMMRKELRQKFGLPLGLQKGKDER